jgi:hypothetical protein
VGAPISQGENRAGVSPSEYRDALYYTDIASMLHRCFYLDASFCLDGSAIGSGCRSRKALTHGVLQPEDVHQDVSSAVTIILFTALSPPLHRIEPTIASCHTRGVFQTRVQATRAFSCQRMRRTHSHAEQRLAVVYCAGESVRSDTTGSPGGVVILLCSTVAGLRSCCRLRWLLHRLTDRRRCPVLRQRRSRRHWRWRRCLSGRDRG